MNRRTQIDAYLTAVHQWGTTNPAAIPDVGLDLRDEQDEALVGEWMHAHGLPVEYIGRRKRNFAPCDHETAVAMTVNHPPYYCARCASCGRWVKAPIVADK